MTSGRIVRSELAAKVVLCVGALLATLTSHPGKVPADTKLYLYLDPGRLISDSIWSWDSRMFSGWVPHQNIGYLWPTGPFYGVFSAFGVPDWVTHRIWLASLFSIAGIGCLRMARLLSLSLSSAIASAFAYQFSPYVLPYISRTSALLIPWALLPWLIIVVSRYGQHRRFRELAIFGLLIASSGGLNATALIMIAPGPLIWLIYQQLERGGSWRKTILPVCELGVTAFLCSVWWLAGLFVQGRYGAAVLSYSEALVSTSETSSSPEVLRGLGYWLFYDRGPAAALTSAAAPYQTSVVVIVLGSGLIIAGLSGIARSGTWRKPLSAMLLVGLVLAVGAHPFSRPSPLFALLANHPTNALSLAVRSSTRAAPLVVLAMAIGIGFLLDTWRLRSTVGRAMLHFVVLTAIIGNFPAAINGDVTDQALLRPEQIPEEWSLAGRYLDQRFDSGYTGSVLLVPGMESAAYRWGYPVDPILPGISRKPLLTRDWLPLGSPALMDVLYAFDDSFQNGTADPNSIAPVARLLGADTVMVVGSQQYERFGTIRPARAAAIFSPVPKGLTLLARFGQPRVNTAPFDRWSEEQVAFPAVPLPEISLYAVNEPEAPARILTDPAVVSGDGTGLIDLAAQGITDGKDLLVSEAGLNSDQLADLSASAHRFVISDSNRRRAHHWRSSQDVWGATEPSIGVLTLRDDFDARLPVHPDQSYLSESIIEAAPVEARATAYGAELRYHPEFRPRMAVDGDLATAWRIGPDRSPIGHILTIHSQEPLSHLQLVQPLDRGAKQWITRVSIRLDQGNWVEIPLHPVSRKPSGEFIPLSSKGHDVDIRIDDVNDRRLYQSSLGVGFAEVVESTLTSPEILRMPNRLEPPRDAEVVYSFNRLRSDPYDRWRDDPESAIRRLVGTPIDEIRSIDFEVRLSHRSSDEVLLDALGMVHGSADSHLDGSPRWWGPSALDDDPATAWITPVSTDTRASATPTITIPLRSAISRIDFEYSNNLAGSTLQRVRIDLRRGSEIVASFVRAVPLPDSSGVSRIRLPSTMADSASLQILATNPIDVIDEFTGHEIASPVALSEIRSDAWQNTALPMTFDSGCRSDLLRIDSTPVPVRLRGSVREALEGKPVDAELCSTSAQHLHLPKGAVLSAVSGLLSGWDFDRIRMSSSDAPSPASVNPALTLHGSRATFATVVPPCPRTCWIEMPFGSSTGWKGSLDHRTLDTLTASSAGRAMWQLPAGSDQHTFTVVWYPQRIIWIGLGISGVACLICLFVLLRASIRKKGNDRSIPSEFTTSTAVRRPLASPARRRLVLVGWCLAVGAVVISPAWGALIAAGVLIIDFVPELLAAFVVTAVALAYGYIIVQQLRYDSPPGFGWPGQFWRTHRPLLAVIALFTVSLHDPRRDTLRDDS